MRPRSTRHYVERFREKLHGRWRWLTVFSVWALPIFPGAPLSITCGFVKIPLLTFVTATYFGSIVNAFIYMYIGYYGLRAVATLNVLELTGQVLVLGFMIMALLWLYRRYRTKPKRSRQ